ncbi:hypothetical protein BOX15_Mlig012312g1, partial [Macrostomum lignano]
DINSRNLVCGFAPYLSEASTPTKPEQSHESPPSALLATSPSLSCADEPDLLDPDCSPGRRIRWTVTCGQCGQVRPTLVMPCGHHYCTGCLQQGKAAQLGADSSGSVSAVRCRRCSVSSGGSHAPVSSLLENFAAKRYLAGYANQAAHLSPVVSEASKPIDDVEAGRLAAAGLAAANRHRLLMDYRDRLLPQLEASLTAATTQAAASIERCRLDYLREVENRRAELLTELASCSATLASEVSSTRRHLMADREALSRLLALVKAHLTVGANPSELAMLLTTVEGKLDEVLNRRYPLLHRDPADCLRYVQPMPVAANAHLLMGAIVYNRQMSKLRQQQPSTGSNNNNYNSHAASTVGDKNNNNTNVQSFNLNRRQSMPCTFNKENRQPVQVDFPNRTCPSTAQPTLKILRLKSLLKLDTTGNRRTSCLAVSPSGDILVADGLGGCVQAFKLSTGCQAYCLGGGGGARCQQDQLKCPELVAVHRATGNIVICDTDQASIRLLLYAFGGRTQLKVFGADAELRAPRALCFDKDGRVLVLDGRSKRRSLGIRDQDAKQFRAVLFNPGCQLLTNFICAQLFEPTGVAVDAVYRLYVSDYCGGCVMVYNYIGDLLSKLGGPGITDQPCGVAVRHTDGAIVVVGSAVLKRPTSSSTAGCYCAILTVLAADSAPSIGVTAGALLKSIELELGTFCKCRKFALSESGHLALLGGQNSVYVYSLA